MPKEAPLAETLAAARYTGPGTDWTEIVGLEHARREIAAVMSLLKHRELAQQVGAELTPLLFVGPAGVGKTLLARAMSRDLDAPMYAWAASELTAPLIRQTFRALASERCLIFIDEIDLIGGDRDRWPHRSHQERAGPAACGDGRHQRAERTARRRRDHQAPLLPR